MFKFFILSMFLSVNLYAQDCLNNHTCIDEVLTNYANTEHIDDPYPEPLNLIWSTTFTTTDAIGNPVALLVNHARAREICSDAGGRLPSFDEFVRLRQKITTARDLAVYYQGELLYGSLDPNISFWIDQYNYYFSQIFIANSGHTLRVDVTNRNAVRCVKNLN